MRKKLRESSRMNPWGETAQKLQESCAVTERNPRQHTADTRAGIFSGFRRRL